jgi:hypothetical protein
MYDRSDGEEDNTKRKTVCFWQFSCKVAVCSGTVATDQGVQILNFFCGFCKGDGGDSLYDDVVSKDCLWK